MNDIRDIIHTFFNLFFIYFFVKCDFSLILYNRAHCLDTIIKLLESLSRTERSFGWNQEFILTLREMLKDGSGVSVQSHGGHRNKWLDEMFFSWAVPRLLFHYKEEHLKTVMEVAPLFVPIGNCEDRSRNILHALVDMDSNWFKMHAKNLPINFFQHYKQIVSKVNECNGKLINATDHTGKPPVSKFIKTMQIIDLPEELLTTTGLGKIIDLANELKSEMNVTLQDDAGDTTMHILADRYNEAINDSGRRLLVALAKLLVNSSNIDIQDCDGSTLLHILISVYHLQDTENGVRMFLELVEFLGYNSDLREGDNKGLSLKNNNGQTVLHVAVENYNKMIPQQCASKFHKLFKHLLSEDNIDSQDGKGWTALHILTSKYPEQIPTYNNYNNLEVFWTLFKIFADGLSKIVADNNGKTVLHLLAEKFPNDIAEGDAKLYLGGIREIVSNISKMKDIQENIKGFTALHVILDNYQGQMAQNCKDIFTDLVNDLKSATNVNYTDNKGRTVLHILANKLTSDPNLASDLLPVVQLLKSSENSKTEDNEGNTACSIILKETPKLQSDGHTEEKLTKIYWQFK